LDTVNDTRRERW